MQDPDTGRMQAIGFPFAKAIREAVGEDNVPIFCLGETLVIRGGHFRVVAIGTRFMRLEGVPGTRIKEGEPVDEPGETDIAR